MAATTDDLVSVQQQGVQNLGLILKVLQGISAFSNFQAPPPTAVSPGVAGQVAYDAGFLYVCVGPSTWKRVALATF